MNQRLSSLVALILSAALIVGVFLLDVWTPIGVAVWLFYLVPLMLASSARSPFIVFAVTGISSCLTVVGIYVSPSGLPLSTTLMNRAMSISVLWIVGAMQVLHMKTEMRLRQSDVRLLYASAAAGLRTWHWDVQRNKRAFDERGKDLFMRTASSDFTNMPYEELIPPGEKKRIEQLARWAFHQREEYAAEVQVAMPDGLIHWILEKGRGFYDERDEPCYMYGIAMDITDRKKTEADLHKLMVHKDVLMKELQHRVKNSLALVSSLLGLEIPNLPDAKSQKVFSETRDRIGAVSRIYGLLYQSTGVTSVDLSRYLKDVAHSLFDAYAERGSMVQLECTFKETDLDTKRAVPLGLILNELVTNALKHAFPDSKGGTVHILLEKSEKDLSLSVSDTGVGLPQGFDPVGATTMGMSLVRLLADEIKGTLSVEGTHGGTQMSVRIPL